MGYVYAIRCKENGRIYIGSTVDLEKRIYVHFLELKNRKKSKESNVNQIKSGDTWQDDYDKFGKDAFEVYCIESDIPTNQLREREAYWMDEYKARDPKYGYNAAGIVRYDHPIKYGIPQKPFQEEKRSLFQNVLDLCEKKDISIARLEKECGLGNATIKAWKDLRDAPRFSTIKKVADYFGVTIDELMGEK